MTIHSSFVYSILYLIFFAYPYSFRQVRGWATGISALPFLGLFLGSKHPFICLFAFPLILLRPLIETFASHLLLLPANSSQSSAAAST